MSNTIEIDIHERLNGLEQEWLINHLEAKRGVREAAFCPSHASRLIVVYDAGVVSSYTVWEICHLFDLRPEFVLPAHARRAERAFGPSSFGTGTIAVSGARL